MRGNARVGLISGDATVTGRAWDDAPATITDGDEVYCPAGFWGISKVKAMAYQGTVGDTSDVARKKRERIW